MADLERRIRELEAEVARLRATNANRDTFGTAGGDDPTVARILSDRGLLASLPEVICLLDRQHRFVYVNRVVPGKRIEDLLGQSSLDFLVEHERESRLEVLERAWATGEVQTIETRTSSGYVWENRFVPVSSRGEVAYLLSTSVDVTERRKAEDALRQSATMLRHAMDATGMGTWIRDREGLRWDDVLCGILGVEQTTEPRAADSFVLSIHPDDRARVVELVARARIDGSLETTECRIIRPSGELRNILVKASIELDTHGEFLRSFGGVLDVTEHRRLEAQLRRVQKMDAIGHLTAGIAHNFNNVLAIILPTVEVARRTADGALADRLDAIHRAGERGAELVRQLMLFARRESYLDRRPIAPHAFVRETVAMCRSTFDARIEIELFVDERAPTILADEGQLEQVLLNLCMNARDALDEAAPEKPHIFVSLERSPKGLCSLRVSDNGAGMSDATRARIFEPFFTTKDASRGTGLGLAMVRGIVSDHDGTIVCTSELGRGTTFVLEFPSVAPDSASASPDVVAEPPRGGDETILVIDDDALVRAATHDILALAGYRVIEVADGSAGVAMYMRERQRIDAVILDRSMPGIPGEQVLASLLDLEPALAVVAMSGHFGSDSPWDRASARLTKPVSSDVLLRAVRDALDARSARRALESDHAVIEA